METMGKGTGLLCFGGFGFGGELKWMMMCTGSVDLFG